MRDRDCAIVIVDEEGEDEGFFGGVIPTRLLDADDGRL
jgi:hypothetical protein